MNEENSVSTIEKANQLAVILEQLFEKQSITGANNIRLAAAAMIYTDQIRNDLKISEDELNKEKFMGED